MTSPLSARASRISLPQVPVDLYDPVDVGTLRPRESPYWMPLYNGRALGVIISKWTGQPSCWMARIRIPGQKRYYYHRLGPFDEMTVHDARKCAEQWFAVHEHLAGPKHLPDLAERHLQTSARTNEYTVAHALNDFLARHGSSGDFSKTEYATAYQVSRYLGDFALGDLTTQDIERWRSAALAVLSESTGTDDNPLERVRKRKSTLNRQLAILRAALTRAFQHRRIDSEAEWRRVAYFKNTQSPSPRPIDPTVIELFRSNCSVDLRRLVDAALYTGCRAAELRRLKCRDLIHDSRKLVVPPAKRSSGRAIILSDEGYAFFAKLADHRKGDEDFVRRQDGRGWTRGATTSQIYRTSRRLPETSSINFHALRHTYATRLRDGGMPLQLIARQLGHKHLRTTEHYYVGLEDSVADAMIREALQSI